MLGALGAFISIANQIVAIGILIVLTTVRFVELIGMVFGSLLLLDQRHVLWQQGVVFPLLLSIAPKILMLMTLAFGQVVTTLALLTTLCGHVLVDLVIWISHLDRVKFSWLGWVFSRSVADIDRVHAWLVFVQRCIWGLRHGS